MAIVLVLAVPCVGRIGNRWCVAEFEMGLKVGDSNMRVEGGVSPVKA